MKSSQFSEEQIAYALRQAESGTAVEDVCRQIGVSEATFYGWTENFAHLGVSELWRMRQLIRRRDGRGLVPPPNEMLWSCAVCRDRVRGLS